MQIVPGGGKAAPADQIQETRTRNASQKSANVDATIGNAIRVSVGVDLRKSFLATVDGSTNHERHPESILGEKEREKAICQNMGTREVNKPVGPFR
jgi:hypothetical protein